jgi:hypothetical protein
MKSFHTWYFLTIKQTILLQEWGLGQNQGEKNCDLLLVSSWPQSHGLGSTLLCKIVALQLVTYFFCPVISKMKWGIFL